jgi:hypothetical protein
MFLSFSKVLNILSADDQIVFMDSEDNLEIVFRTLYTVVSKGNLGKSEKEPSIWLQRNRTSVD